MSYPSNLKLFRAWAKAMEQGATVGKPNYSAAGRNSTRRYRRRRTKRHRRRVHSRRKKNAD